MRTQNYNPDVLTCLANLSNDEVFTPPAVVNKMLDMLPADLWSNPDARFLDPVSKTGVFLREIAKRLMEGLAEQIPDVQQRADHIFGKQLYGLAITELTALMSRRSVYCSKYANGRYSVCTTFDDEQGNIRYEPTAHTWQNGRCIYCGASQEVYDRGGELESHAYRFIHTDNPKKLYPNMKFDVIIGNPPYQLSDGSGGSSDSAMPIYNKFIEQAMKLKPRYLSMIIPSKWMMGGRGLQSFRNLMMDEVRIKRLVDYENSADCFGGLHIDGGVCYFLWDSTYSGKTDYTFVSNSGDIIRSDKTLKNKYFKYVIRDNRILSLLDKTHSDKRFSDIVSNVRPFGIRGYLFNTPERYPDSGLQLTPFPGCIKMYGVKGIKGGAKRIEGYVYKRFIKTNVESIDKYKIFFTTSYSTNAVKPPEPILGNPGTACTETFLQVGSFASKEQQENCLSYIHTNFFKVLLYFGKGTMHVTKDVFDLIPLQNFNESWTDEKLYTKYGLTDEEIAFIESMIRPME